MLIFSVFLALFSVAQADWEKVPAGTISVSPPPSADSQEAKQEFVILHQFQNNRSEADCKLAMTQTIPNFDTFYSKSGLLSAEEVAAVGAFVQRAMLVADKVTMPLKKQFSRPRPYNEDPTLIPCATKPSGSLSFPSSHASMAVTGACALGAIFPSKADQFEKYALYLAQLRVISGVHHPSDIVAGESIGQQICQYLLQNNEFMQDVQKLALPR